MKQIQSSAKSQHIVPKAGLAAASVLALAAMSVGNAFAVEYANVVSAVPVRTQVGVPSQQCQDVPQAVARPSTGAGAVVGAVVGGVLGHAIGGGFGQAAATGLGVVGGAAIGDNVEANTNPRQTVMARQCQNLMTYENRVIGYDVTYEYQGKRYTSRLSQDPGPKLALDVNVTPAAGTSEPLGNEAQANVSPTSTYDTPIGVPVNGGYAVPPPPSYEPAPAYSSSYYAAPAYYPQPVYATPQPSFFVAPSLFIGVGGGGHRRWR